MRVPDRPGLAAQRTERIGLGPGVLVPSLGHPMVNAAATATLSALAPGRVAVSFGTGFTGRRAMGYPGHSLVVHGFLHPRVPGAAPRLPGGDEWLAVVEQAPEQQRHLTVHSGHCVALNAADEASWRAGGSSTLRDVTLSGTRDEIRRILEDYGSRGVTEIVFQPCGPDARRELERFLDAARA